MNNIINFITQHTVLSIGFIIVIVGYVAFESFMWLSGGSIEYQSKVSVNQLVMLFNHNNALIVDLRSPDNYKAGHLIDSVNIPLNEFNIHHKLIKSNNRPIILICDHGRSAAQIAVDLRKANVKKEVFFLEGGFISWKSAGLPIYSEHNKILKNHGKKIVIYTKDSCPYSVSAKNLLRNKGYSFKEIKIHHNNSTEFNEMVQLSSGLKTVPQIFINGKHIGGFDELKELDEKSEL